MTKYLLESIYMEPIKKVIELENQLIKILDANEKLDRSQEWNYISEIETPLNDEFDKVRLKAYLYACLGDYKKALSFFSTLKGFNEPLSMANYLIFLFKNGYVKKYIDETININKQLPHNPILLKFLGQVYFSQGKLAKLEQVYKQFINLKLVNETNELQNKIAQLTNFKKKVGLDDAQLQKLLMNYCMIADKNNLREFQLYFDDLELGDDSFNRIIGYANCDDLDKLVEMEFELADKLSTDDLFIGTQFSAHFESENNVSWK